MNLAFYILIYLIIAIIIIIITIIVYNLFINKEVIKIKPKTIIMPEFVPVPVIENQISEDIELEVKQVQEEKQFAVNDGVYTINESTDGKCGINFGNTKCPQNQCCSKDGECGRRPSHCIEKKPVFSGNDSSVLMPSKLQFANFEEIDETTKNNWEPTEIEKTLNCSEILNQANNESYKADLSDFDIAKLQDKVIILTNCATNNNRANLLNYAIPTINAENKIDSIKRFLNIYNNIDSVQKFTNPTPTIGSARFTPSRVISTNNKCGPNNDNTYCPEGKCCSPDGICGSTSEFCKSGNETYHGDNSPSYNGLCGTRANGAKCPDDMCCTTNNQCTTACIEPMNSEFNGSNYFTKLEESKRVKNEKCANDFNKLKQINNKTQFSPEDINEATNIILDFDGCVKYIDSNDHTRNIRNFTDPNGTMKKDTLTKIIKVYEDNKDFVPIEFIITQNTSIPPQIVQNSISSFY